MVNKYDIPLTYYIDIEDNGFQYCFDIRSLIKLLETSDINPYTTKKFTYKNIKKIDKKVQYLKNNGISTAFNFCEDITEDQKFTHRMVDIFHKFDMLDNYTDHRWFSDLTLNKLKEFYYRAENLWNYRSQLTMDQKKRIVKNGIAFNIPHNVIHRVDNNNKRKFQEIILNEFERFATEGIDINEKKLGVMLILTIFVEVSIAAARALPHLSQ